MLSSQTENQATAGASAEEIDLLRRSKKKTKRGAHERDDESMQMEEDGQTSSTLEPGKHTEEQFGSQAQPARRADNQGASRPLGDKYGTWMIAQRKNRNYQNTGDQRRNTGRQTGGRFDYSKGKDNGSQGNNTYHFNKAGFKVWNNTRFGALENYEEEYDEEAQEEHLQTDRPEGPTGALLAGKGKRPQVQISEAQLQNDNMRRNRENNMNKQTVFREKQKEKSAEKSRKHVNQAAETENHTVVRGFDNGNRVERTVINEEGSTTEISQFQAEASEHHQDPPNADKALDTGDDGDPMADVVFETERNSADSEPVEYRRRIPKPRALNLDPERVKVRTKPTTGAGAQDLRHRDGAAAPVVTRVSQEPFGVEVKEQDEEDYEEQRHDGGREHDVPVVR
nr:uncharacterized protein LOC109158743 [Ipomoea batatas]